MKKQSSDVPARLSLPPMPSMTMKKAEIIGIYQNMASLVSRAAMSGMLGQTFGGLRDVYDVCGWKKNLVFDDYWQMYDRNGIAGRIVDALSDESWRKPPALLDGKVRSDDKDPNKLTPFLKAWNEFTEKYDLWPLVNELDTSLGYSRYAVMLIGAAGKFDQPLDKATAINYLQVYDEGQAPISTFDRAAASLRYGMPTSYSVTFEDGGRSIPVHYTRVLHCKEGQGRSRVYGAPRLKRPYNYLSDLEKVVGSSSEAFWLLIRKGLVLSAQQGQNFPTKDTPAYEDMQAEIQEWEHQLRRVMRLQGVDVSDLGAQVVDGRQQHDLLITDIAGTVGMPQRVLVGSERGELASTQDDSNWASVVEARQMQTCKKWVVDIYKRFVELGTLPQPTSKVTVEFPELFKMTKPEKVAVMKSEADTINAVTGNAPETYLDVGDWLKQNFPQYKFTEEPVVQEEEEIVPEEEGKKVNVESSGQGLAGEQVTQLMPA